MSTSQEKSKRILFCVLNWGLGHATRSIPIIQLLLARGHDVSLASDGRAEALLRAEFPELIMHPLPSYGVRYTFKSMFLNLLYQWPNVLLTMIREHFVLQKLTNKHAYDVIISDNRYGCFHGNILSIGITHQINPMTSFWLTDLIARWVSRLLLANFDSIWIPDDPEMGCLAGPMVKHPPKHANFIGFISRFTQDERQDKQDSEIDIVVILSGPEPLRTDFEQKVIQQMADFTGTWVMVQGKTEGQKTWQHTSPRAKSINFLTSSELESLIKSANLIVSRSGYTSLMDYLILGSKALIIPTPGQYEQEYLANNIPDGMPFVGSNETEMDILACFNKLEKTSSAKPYENYLLKSALEALIN